MRVRVRVRLRVRVRVRVRARVLTPTLTLTVDSLAYSGSVATVGVTTGAHGRTSAARPGVGGFELTTIASVG